MINDEGSLKFQSNMRQTQQVFSVFQVMNEKVGEKI